MSSNRELDEKWIGTATSWIEDTGEGFIHIRYLYNSPPMNFAVVHSPEELQRVIAVCPDGAELTLYRDIQAPIRGVLDDELVARVKDFLPEKQDCVCVLLESGSDTDPRLSGDSWLSMSDMLIELPQFAGHSVAIGAFPGAEAERIQAVKGGLEGPR